MLIAQTETVPIDEKFSLGSLGYKRKYALQVKKKNFYKHLQRWLSLLR